MGLDVYFYERYNNEEYKPLVWSRAWRMYIPLQGNNIEENEIGYLRKPYLFMDWMAAQGGITEIENQAFIPVPLDELHELVTELRKIEGTEGSAFDERVELLVKGSNKKWSGGYADSWQVEGLLTELVKVLRKVHNKTTEVFVYTDW